MAVPGGAGDKKADKAHKKANKYVQGDVLVSVAAFIRDAEKVPRCEKTTCAQCHTEGACYQDASEAYDADGDGKLQDHEGGGFYCEECWTGVYGVPPKKAPPRSKEGACAQCQTSTRCYQDANEAYVRRATLSVLGPIILYTLYSPFIHSYSRTYTYVVCVPSRLHVYTSLYTPNTPQKHPLNTLLTP